MTNPSQIEKLDVGNAPLITITGLAPTLEEFEAAIKALPAETQAQLVELVHDSQSPEEFAEKVKAVPALFDWLNRNLGVISALGVGVSAVGVAAMVYNILKAPAPTVTNIYVDPPIIQQTPQPPTPPQRTTPRTERT